MGFVSKVMWLFKPIIEWIDKTFTLKKAIKIVDGDHYYLYRDRIEKGDVFLTSTKGHGSNLINPSEFSHGAIYFGKGLRTEILRIIETYKELAKSEYINKKIKRLDIFLRLYNINDDICYVIEAVGQGVIATNLVKFMTTKDRLICFKPLFATTDQKGRAANVSVEDLGKPYDYGFAFDSKYRYCFEVPANAYESVVPNLILKRHSFEIFWKTVHQSFLADTFYKDPDNWKMAFDIHTPFKNQNL